MKESSWALRMVRRLPLPLVAAPEQVVLNVAAILIGFSAVVARKPGAILFSWPPFLLVAWALAMSVGGACVLFGLFRHKTTTERLGYILVAPAAFIYAVAAVWIRGLPGLPVAFIFLALMTAKVIRLVISSAERDMTLEIGARLDREERDAQEDS